MLQHRRYFITPLLLLKETTLRILAIHQSKRWIGKSHFLFKPTTLQTHQTEFSQEPITSDELCQFLDYVSEEVPQFDIRYKQNCDDIQQVIIKLQHLKHQCLLTEAIAVRCFLALGDITGLPTLKENEANSISSACQTQRDVSLYDTTHFYDRHHQLTALFLFKTDIFTPLSAPLQFTNTLSGHTEMLTTSYSKYTVFSIQNELLALLKTIDASHLSADAIVQLSEMFEYLPSSSDSREIIKQFWNQVIRHLYDSVLNFNEDNLVKLLRSQIDTQLILKQFIDFLIKKISLNFQYFEEKHISEICTLFSTLRYKDDQWIQLLAKELPFVLHQYHFNSIVQISEYFVSLNLGVSELGIELGHIDLGQELIDRFSRELWRWIPRMRHNFIARSIRSLVMLGTSDERSLKLLLKMLPGTLYRRDLHHGQLLADTFIACALNPIQRPKLLNYIIFHLIPKLEDIELPATIIDILWACRHTPVSFFSADLYHSAIDYFIKPFTVRHYPRSPPHFNYLLHLSREVCFMDFPITSLIPILFNKTLLENDINECTPSAITSFLFVLGCLSYKQYCPHYLLLKPLKQTAVMTQNNPIQIQHLWLKSFDSTEFHILVNRLCHILIDPGQCILTTHVCQIGAAIDSRWRILLQEAFDSQLVSRIKDGSSECHQDDIYDNVQLQDQISSEIYVNCDKTKDTTTSLNSSDLLHQTIKPNDDSIVYLKQSDLHVPAIRLEKEGINYLSLEDIIYLLYGLCLLPISTTHLIILQSIEQWLLHHPIDKLSTDYQICMLVYSLAELNPNSTLFQHITENVMNQYIASVPENNLPILLISCYALNLNESTPPFQTILKRIIQASTVFDSYRGSLVVIVAYCLQQRIEIKADEFLKHQDTKLYHHLNHSLLYESSSVHQENQISHTESFQTCSHILSQFLHLIISSDTWEHARQFNMLPHDLTDLNEVIQWLNTKNVIYELDVKNGCFTIDIAITGYRHLDQCILFEQPVALFVTTSTKSEKPIRLIQRLRTTYLEKNRWIVGTLTIENTSNISPQFHILMDQDHQANNMINSFIHHTTSS